jgi:4-amino-4-deoxy-L-arabinose transferase-like glycosyltransferase
MDTQKTFRWAIALTLLVNAAAMLSPVINSGDALTYATLSHHMVQSDDWVRLVLDGQDWLDKPHLPFWITALFFKLGGVSAQTYILPGFLFHLIGAYYTYRLARWFYGKEVALLAVLVYVSVYNLMDASIEIKAETYLIGFIMPACYYWLRYDAEFRWKHLLLGAAFTGMAVMTKGIFTLFTIFSGLGILWLYRREWLQALSPKWLAAYALSLLFVAPELIALQMQFSSPAQVSGAAQPVSALKFFFWDSQFGRFLNTGPIQNHNGSPYYFVLVFIWAFLPWTLIFPAAVRGELRGFRARPFRERAAFVFLTSAFAASFLMFSATKFQLDYYIDIIFPFAAILSAHYLQERIIGRSLFFAQMGLLALLALIATALAIYIHSAPLLALTAAFLVALAFAAYRTRGAPLNFRAIVYSVLTVNLVYAFLALMTAQAFLQYSLPYNAARILGSSAARAGAPAEIPVYVYQMPEAEKELALYSKAPCYQTSGIDPAHPPAAHYYLVIRHEQAIGLPLPAGQFRQTATLDVVVHKTGPFNKLLQLAKGERPLERIDILEVGAPRG